MAALSTKKKIPRVPELGEGMSTRMDRLLIGDLKILRHTGLSLTDIVKTAVMLMARCYESAWEQGLAPHGQEPVVLGYIIARPGQGTERLLVPPASSETRKEN